MLSWEVTITPVDGSDAITIEGQTQVEGPANGRYSFAFEELLEDYLTSLEPVLATRVEHYANRAGTREAYTDPGCKLVTVSWSEVDPYSGSEPQLTARSETGVLELGGYSSSALANSMRLTLYVCNYRYERGTEIEESV